MYDALTGKHRYGVAVSLCWTEAELAEIRAYDEALEKEESRLRETEAAKAAKARYRAKNREKIAAYCREYRKKNREAISARRRKEYQQKKGKKEA